MLGRWFLYFKIQL